ncbi:CHAT domain-containing protein [Neobacillus niacini]|uniref:CHAT domain-containing protein n=1 Tax=Neobacillus niacini TaxID=86668 RepID=UPI002862E1CF|nr:CHAT domain-containing protein [Neobacillus niacini]MDR7002255.1 Skp family chaperone for outer membrane proteins [Neobacillus niacini]
MALIDSYRSNILRKKNELAKLQSDRANETKKIPTQTNKILSAKKAIARTKSMSTIQTKYREIERAEKELATINKKLADIDRKIARKETEIFVEEKKLSRENESEQKKRDTAEKKRIVETEKRMKEVNNILDKHSKLHSETNRSLEELKNIPEKITVLFIASNPINVAPLRLDEEAREIQEMIRKTEYRDSVSFVTRWATRPLDVLQAINEEKPTVIHFSGHGSDKDEIVFQDNQGNAKLVSKEAIVQTMMSTSDSIRLVFFNTCFSFGQAQAVTEHVDAAIGMTTSIGDDTARVFAAQFYSAIGFGLSIQKAFDQGKTALMLEGIPEESTLELYFKEGLNPNELIIVKP